jgi:glutamyl-tRNA synthetase
MTIRVRFAPSPTGYLHIGGARTALFNWLYARHTDGKFLLRIEDTDLERSTETSMQAILEGLAWLGISHDEDIVIQSTRRDEHLRLAHRLLDEGKAYRCFCTADELEKMREQALAEGRKPKYDGRWRDRTDAPAGDVPHTIRFKMPTEGSTTIPDIVLGDVTVSHEELDDLIIVRSDGTPTYNFVVVCDDAFMNVNHVVRGQDHMSNTFRQWHIYHALGHEPPRFAHLPLVDGLSKRKGSASVQHYRDIGYLSEAVVNYIARLGWSHGDQEIFSVAELIEAFDLVDVNRGSGKYDEDKMAWVNTQWMKRLELPVLAERTLPFLAARGIETSVDARLLALVDSLRERSANLVQLADGAVFAWRAPSSYAEAAVKKWMQAAVKPAYEGLIAALEAAEAFDASAVEATFKSVIESHGLALGKLAQPVRIALTGDSVSPPIFDTVAIVGREETLRRLRAALGQFSQP